MTTEWVEEQLTGGPSQLVERTRHFLTPAPDSSAEGLAGRARAALAAAIDSGADRRGALDLLAADALVTLALAARNESDPGSLAAFARSLLQVPASSP